MDRQFVLQNNIVERYLAGKLPPKGAQEFERFCREHPELLEELHLADQLQAALRLLEAGGQAMPWEEQPKRWWEKLPVLIAVSALCVVLLITSLVNAGRLSTQAHKSSALQRQLADQPLDPAESTRVIRILPSRTAPSQQSLVTIGGGRAELADLKINMSWSKYSAFTVTIDRIDQGRVAILHSLLRDSNGDVRIALNSSALGPGDYQLTLDGMTWSGAPVAQAWARITIARSAAEDP